mmetsp:Transcript_118032/g.220563  ORF Transcript_118032/g.220563 Transcript_118032/m.220563 type:complete len:746 (+) Transcript_118032:70-2307(+)
MDLGYLRGLGLSPSTAPISLKLPEEAASVAAPPAAGKAAAKPAADKKANKKAAGKAAAASPPAAKAEAKSKAAPKGVAKPADAAPKEKKAFGFLQEWIEGDLADGGRCAVRRPMKGDVIRTRFPPEPNGYLHIGHAKSITVNFGLAEMFGGRCHLRFDDTNPAAEETEFVESIKEDVRWLGFDWGEHCYFASNYFDQLYEWAEFLIKEGKAYVDSQTKEDIRKNRGNVTTPGTNSPFRERSPDENMKLFREMRDGKYKEGEHVLRMKGDMTSSNMNMRDMPIFRILHKSHHQTGDKWCIYPLYDFAHGQEDAIEGITHSICTLEFEAHRELYDWFTNNLPIEEKPLQWEMGRLNVTTFLTSKRKLKKLVTAKVVDGWDDPRMSTLSGLRRRGVSPEALKTFILKVGVTRQITMSQVSLLEDCILKDLEAKCARRMVVLDPIKVVIEDYPQDKEEEVEAANHPQMAEMGSRKLKFSRELWIERDDFMEDAPESYFRLRPGGEVKLRYSYVIKVKDVVKDAKGIVTELRCTHDPDSRDGMPTDRKVKGVIHWVSAKHSVTHPVRLYDYLIKPQEGDDAPPAEEVEEAEEDEEAAEEDDDKKMREFLAQVNPESLIELKTAKLEAALAETKPFERFQFERNGYFVVDKYSKEGCPIFNRIVKQKESSSRPDTVKTASRKDEQAAAAAAKEAKKNIDPRQMFRAETDKYSQFDEDGVPTHDAEGLALNKTRCKKLKQEWEKQNKLFSKS